MGIPPILNVCRHDTDNRALVTPTGEIGLKPAPLTPTPLTPTPAERCPHVGRRTIHVDVDVFALIHTFVGIPVRPRARDRDEAWRLRERLLAEHRASLGIDQASLGAALADRPDRPAPADLRRRDRTDAGGGRRAAERAVPLTPALPSGVRTAVIPKGLDHRSWTRWSP
jgi:hypothetical protein